MIYEINDPVGWAWAQQPSSSRRKFVMAALAQHARYVHRAGWVYGPDLRLLVESTQLSLDTVTSSLLGLANEGLVEMRPSGGGYTYDWWLKTPGCKIPAEISGQDGQF